MNRLSDWIRTWSRAGMLVVGLFFVDSTTAQTPPPNPPAGPTIFVPGASETNRVDASRNITRAATGTETSTSSQPAPWRLNIGMEGGAQPGDISVAIQLVVLMTLLTMAPSIVMLMTSFTRVVIVLSFVRTAIGVQSAPSNQIIVGLSLFLTFFLMGPTIDRINADALQPYLSGQMSSSAAIEKASAPLRDFMLKQTRTRDLEFFLQLGRFPPTKVQELPLRVVIPAFVISELQTAFQMGFLLFLPFLVIDFIVSSVLMAMGMMMMPPSVVSLPFKLLLFVLVDGWHLVVKSIVESFR